MAKGKGASGASYSGISNKGGLGNYQGPDDMLQDSSDEEKAESKKQERAEYTPSSGMSPQEINDNVALAHGHPRGKVVGDSYGKASNAPGNPAGGFVRSASKGTSGY